MIPLQFISHTSPTLDYEASMLMALEAGCKWIQLRMKGATDDEVRPIALRVLEKCKQLGAMLILDDRVELSKEIGADGVHLGKTDMPVNEAREILGHEMIIGGTANTLDDVVRLKRLGADYVGCGPLRFTTTKDHLAPLLGMEGYRSIIEQMQTMGLRIPLVAIGGVTLDDVMPLMELGVSGIAVSGAILRAECPAKAMKLWLHADAD